MTLWYKCTLPPPSLPPSFPPFLSPFLSLPPSLPPPGCRQEEGGGHVWPVTHPCGVATVNCFDFDTAFDQYGIIRRQCTSEGRRNCATTLDVVQNALHTQDTRPGHNRTQLQLNLSIANTLNLNKGHLSIEDTACYPNYTKLCTNVPLK